MGVLDWLYGAFHRDLAAGIKSLKDQQDVLARATNGNTIAIGELTTLSKQIKEIAMAGKAELDTVLDRIETSTTKLGQDLKDVFTAIKNNPGGDLTAEVTRGNSIADALIQADADTLAQLDPIPVPDPGAKRS